MKIYPDPKKPLTIDQRNMVLDFIIDDHDSGRLISKEHLSYLVDGARRVRNGSKTPWPTKRGSGTAIDEKDIKTQFWLISYGINSQPDGDKEMFNIAENTLDEMFELHDEKTSKKVMEKYKRIFLK